MLALIFTCTPDNSTLVEPCTVELRPIGALDGTVGETV